MTFKDEDRMSPADTKVTRKNYASTRENHVPTRIQSELIKINVESVQASAINNFIEDNAEKIEIFLEEATSPIEISNSKQVDNNHNDQITSSHSPSLDHDSISVPKVPTSSSFDNSFLKKSSGPSYERRLLKNRHDTNDVVTGYHSDDASERYSIRIKTNENEHKGGSWDRKHSTKERDAKLDNNENDAQRKPSRHHSFSLRKHTQPTDKAYDSASPNLIRKLTSSAKQNNSLAVKTKSFDSSSAAENEKEETKKSRKLSLGKRKKSSTNQKTTTDCNVKEEAERHRRPSRFRRRALTDQMTHGSSKEKARRKSRTESIGMDNMTFKIYTEPTADKDIPKMMLFYSGRSNDTTRYSDARKSSFSENDDSATSDIECKMKSRKSQQHLAKRVWRSINSLFQAEDKVKKVEEKITQHTPPTTRKVKVNKTLSRSMPGGLHWSKLDIKHRRIDRTSKDDFFLDALHKEQNKSTLSVHRSMSFKLPKKMKQLVKHESKPFLSKSLDQLLDDSDGFEADDWYKKSTSKVVPGENRQHGTKYDVIISQNPVKPAVHTEAKDDTQYAGTEKRLSAAFSFSNFTDLQKKMVEKKEKRFTQSSLIELKATLKIELESFLKDKTFQPDKTNTWCRLLSESIKNRVTHVTNDNYKVVAQVFLAALHEDGIHAAVKSTCSKTKDVFFTVTYRGNNLFAVATVLAIEID